MRWLLSLLALAGAVYGGWQHARAERWKSAFDGTEDARKIETLIASMRQTCDQNQATLYAIYPTLQKFHCVRPGALAEKSRS